MQRITFWLLVLIGAGALGATQPALVPWGLQAWDECTRKGTLTGCEQMEWICSASAQIEVLAEVALTGGMWKSGDVFAKAQGEFQVWVDGVVRAVEIRECKAGTQDLETNNP